MHLCKVRLAIICKVIDYSGMFFMALDQNNVLHHRHRLKLYERSSYGPSVCCRKLNPHNIFVPLKPLHLWPRVPCFPWFFDSITNPGTQGSKWLKAISLRVLTNRNENFDFEVHPCLLICCFTLHTRLCFFKTRTCRQRPRLRIAITPYLQVGQLMVQPKLKGNKDRNKNKNRNR